MSLPLLLFLTTKYILMHILTLTEGIQNVCVVLLAVNYSFCDIFNWSFCHFRMGATPSKLHLVLVIELVVKWPSMGGQEHSLRGQDPMRPHLLVQGRCLHPPSAVRNTKILHLCSGSPVTLPLNVPPSCRWCPCTTTTRCPSSPAWSRPCLDPYDHHTTRAGSWLHHAPVTRNLSPCLQSPPWLSTTE